MTMFPPLWICVVSSESLQLAYINNFGVIKNLKPLLKVIKYSALDPRIGVEDQRHRLRDGRQGGT